MQALAEPLRIDDLARHAELNEVRLSPSGEFLARSVPSPDGKETRLQVLRVDGAGTLRELHFSPKGHVADLEWASDTQIVMSRANNRPFRPRPVSFGELMTSDIDGRNQDLLFGYMADALTASGRRKDHGFARVVGRLPDEPGNVLVEFNCWDCGDRPDTTIFKVDSTTGVRTEVERATGPGWFMFDANGRARLRTTYDEHDEPVLAYRPTPMSDWLPMPRALAGYAITDGAFTGDPNIAYLEISDARETAKFYRVDLAAGTRTQVLANPEFEAQQLLRAGPRHEPFGAMYTAGKLSVRYFDPSSDWAKLHAGLMKAFPGELVTIVDTSTDGRRVLFRVTSDRHPGAYYLFDRPSTKVSLVGEEQPWIRPDDMASTVPVDFTTRDGLHLYGFYTATGDETRPLVVLPHGGPFGITDTWGYDPDAQFLASRGYGVLKVNFRGSGGRGTAFQRSGWGHWSDLLINDMVDGARWAVANRIAPADQVCIYGASYGGYAAMQAPRAAPGVFSCAIGYAGVYDLPLWVRDKKNLGSKSLMDYFARTLGTDPAQLAGISPSRNAQQIGVPVLLIHGKDDENARVEQFAAMSKALAAAGVPPESYVVSGEGHGFYSPEAQGEMYRRIEAFLERQLKASR